MPVISYVIPVKSYNDKIVELNFVSQLKLCYTPLSYHQDESMPDNKGELFKLSQAIGSIWGMGK